MSHKERATRARELMRDAGIGALLLTKPANLLYFTGVGQLCAYAVVSQDGQVALGVPFIDLDDVSSRAHYDEITGFNDEVSLLHSISHFVHHMGLERAQIGLEYTFVTKSREAMFTHPHALPPTVTVVDATPLLSELRMVKEPEEIELLKGAGGVAQAGIAAAIKAARPGVTEIEVTAEAEHAMRMAGAEGFYHTYVASGPRTKVAHGYPTYRVIEENDLVTVDLHPVYHGYSGDLCRTFCAGTPSTAQREAMELLLSAQQDTLWKAREGVNVRELEEALHDPIKAAGHGDRLFGPPIHGVGIEFEEAPLPSGHAYFHGEGEPPPLRANTVLAVGNCGLYMDNFGVRVEDTVVVTSTEPIILTDYARKLF
jgi:Xaa-Pro aminopeptidase